MGINSSRVATHAVIWRNGLYTLLTSFISIALSTGSGILIARSLGPTGKGEYDLVLATAGLLGIGLSFSLSTGVTYVVAKERAALGILTVRLAFLALLQGGLAAIILLLLQPTKYSIAFLPSEMRSEIIGVVVIFLCATELSNHWRAMLSGRQEILLVNKIDLFGRILFLVMLVISVGIYSIMGNKISPMLFIWINVVTVILTSALFLRVVSRFFQSYSNVGSGLREVIKYAFPCYLANLAQFLNYRLDVFIVSFFCWYSRGRPIFISRQYRAIDLVDL